MKDIVFTALVAVMCSTIAVFTTLVLTQHEEIETPIEPNQCTQTVIVVSGTTSH